MTTIAQLLKTHNALAALLGKRQLKSFKGRKAVLAERVAVLTALAPSTGKKRGIGDRCVDLLRAGLTNEQVLANILREFPAAKTTVGCVYWYRCKFADRIVAE